MRALVLHEAGPTFETDHPAPDLDQLPADEALVRVHQAGICNTDLELIRGYAAFRGVLGHEFVGVVEASPGDPAWVGRRVVGEINIPCGLCEMCRSGLTMHCLSRAALGIRDWDGAFADYLSLPLENLHPVPEGVSDDQAVFTEPLAAALSVLSQTQIRPQDRVILLGDGKLGQLIAQVLALTGCNLTVEGHHADKLALLESLGIATRRTETGDEEALANVVVEATGTPSGFIAAQRRVRPRGTLVLKSTYRDLPSTDLSKIVVDELRVVGSRCGPFGAALRLLERDLVKVEPLIHARYPLEEGVAALEHASQQGTLKILLEM
jgi:threonine dehydrogenase-like Zn-dependent dehydrogenase